MTRTPTFTAALLACAGLCAAPALARDVDDLRDDPPSARRLAERTYEPEPTWAWELVMGFGGGLVDPSRVPLVVRDGDAMGAAALTSPFGTTQLLAAGPAWEVRVVQSHARFTLGAQKPFAQFPSGSLDQDVDLGGQLARVSPRSLTWWTVRVGLGAELTFGRVTPFVDLLGDVQFGDGAVVVGATPAGYGSTSFAFVARGGLRLRLDRHLTMSLAGEVGLVGAPRFGATVLMGWVLPVK
ncbi:MAG: hypothetical protein SFW67_08120 [Myxococcaceae bacterium]|nr:hypothetical protein [Myxococcaceae bacterium]